MKYFKIEGIVELPDDHDLESASDVIIIALEHEKGFFGGGMREVDSEGNDLK